MIKVHTLDVRAFRCPMPLLKLKQHLNTMQIGEQVELIVSDAGALRDIPAFLHHAQHSLIKQVEQNGAYYFLIEKGVATL